MKNTRQIHASIIQHAKLQVIRNSDIYTSKDHIFQSNTQHFTNKNNKKKYQTQLFTSLKTKLFKELNYISQTKTKINIQLIGI